MSIYPVKLCEWFPVGDEMHENAYCIVTTLRCYACGKKCRWKAAVGHHSLPWGNGDLWCSWKCCNSRKVHKMDKRQERTVNRRFGKIIPGDIELLLKNHAK